MKVRHQCGKRARISESRRKRNKYTQKPAQPAEIRTVKAEIMALVA